MGTKPIDKLAVCSWSLQPTSADDLIQKLTQTGLSRLQVGLRPLREDSTGAWSGFQEKCATAGVELVSGMFETVGEDYSTLDSIKRTGGVVPDEHWQANRDNVRQDLENAQQLGLKYVGFHAGFLPHEESDPDFAKLLDRVRWIADLYAASGVVLGLETGQEDAPTLARFLRQLNRPNVGVNFDPANMILYDKGDPIESLRALGPWLRQCHIKDANRTATPGTWGEEVVVGTGQVDWRAFFGVLDELNYTGELCIEREAGDQRAADIRTAREYLESLLNG